MPEPGLTPAEAVRHFREQRRRRLMRSQKLSFALGALLVGISVTLSAFMPARVEVILLEYEEIVSDYEPALPDGAAFLPEIVYRTIESGRASYYGRAFAGKRTANGEIFDPELLTAAHPSLPFGSTVRITNTRNGQNVVVRINDRGPFIENRIIDVSRAAASELGFVRRGTAPVKLELLISS